MIQPQLNELINNPLCLGWRALPKNQSRIQIVVMQETNKQFQITTQNKQFQITTQNK